MSTLILNRVKYSHNLAAAIRASACFGVERLFWTGSRFSFADGERLPREERMKGYSSVKFLPTERPFDQLSAKTVPVCVELTPTAIPLTHFVHPEDAAYVFGPEDGHVCQAFRCLCHMVIFIPSFHCLNLAAAINVVLADRLMKRQHAGLEPVLDAGAMLRENRGVAGAIDSIPGWDGK